MRHLKKYASLLLALVMALALAAPAFAAGGETPPADPTPTETGEGKITIDNAIPKQTYTIYRIFDVKSYTTDGKFSYQVVDAWKDFFAAPTETNKTAGPGYAYVQLDKDGYIANAEGLEDNAAEFAKVALAWATDSKNGVSAVKSATAEEATEGATTSTVEFNNLPLGYYLVDSTAGTLCSLNTTAKEATIKEKNEVPSIEKKVKEDDATNQEPEWGKTNDADIGDTVYFQTSISVKPGAQNYVLHDKMDATQLASHNVTSVKYAPKDANGNFTNFDDVPKNGYKVLPTDTESVCNNGCTFEVKFEDEWLTKLDFTGTTEYQIVVEYTAVVQAGAVIAGNGNKNETWLKYGDSGETTHDTTTTYVWEFDILKYTETEQTNADGSGTTTVRTPLAGAKFTLSKNADGTDPISFALKEGSKTETLADGSETVTPDVYRVAVESDTKTTTVLETTACGKIQLEGLDGGIYYLTETEAPAGYNKLASAVTVKITRDADATDDVPAGTVYNGEANTTDNVIEVENNTGAVLPSTGGIGTTIFYVVGGVLVVGAAILLVTKKRMSSR